MVATQSRAQWSSTFVSDLPDSAFAYIEPGGELDDDGKTKPRSLRHFPHHDMDGSVDLPHLRNALARAPQSPYGPKALPHLKSHAKAAGIGDENKDAWLGGLERRFFPMELRVEGDDEEDGAPRINGYAAVFNALSEPLMGFREQIEPGAFGKTLRGKPDIRAFWNHNPQYVLGRTAAGTLSLAEDEHGLAVEIDPPETQWARDLLVSLKRGDVSQMSFGFVPVKDSWSGDGDDTVRTLHEVRLLEVSIVSMPAYPQTSVQARAVFGRLGIDLDELLPAIEAGDHEPIEAAARALMAQVPQHEPEPPAADPDESDWQLQAANRSRLLILKRRNGPF